MFGNNNERRGVSNQAPAATGIWAPFRRVGARKFSAKRNSPALCFASGYFAIRYDRFLF